MPPHSLSKPLINLCFFRAEISNFLRILTYNSFWNLIWFRLKKISAEPFSRKKIEKFMFRKIFFFEKNRFFFCFSGFTFWSFSQICFFELRLNFVWKKIQKNHSRGKKSKNYSLKKIFFEKKTLFLWRFWKKNFV